MYSFSIFLYVIKFCFFCKPVFTVLWCGVWWCFFFFLCYCYLACNKFCTMLCKASDTTANYQTCSKNKTLVTFHMTAVSWGYPVCSGWSQLSLERFQVEQLVPKPVYSTCWGTTSSLLRWLKEAYAGSGTWLAFAWAAHSASPGPHLCPWIGIIPLLLPFRKQDGLFLPSWVASDQLKSQAKQQWVVSVLHSKASPAVLLSQGQSSAYIPVPGAVAYTRGGKMLSQYLSVQWNAWIQLVPVSFCMNIPVCLQQKITKPKTHLLFLPVKALRALLVFLGDAFHSIQILS